MEGNKTVWREEDSVEGNKTVWREEDSVEGNKTTWREEDSVEGNKTASQHLTLLHCICPALSAMLANSIFRCTRFSYIEINNCHGVQSIVKKTVYIDNNMKYIGHNLVKQVMQQRKYAQHLTTEVFG